MWSAWAIVGGSGELGVGVKLFSKRGARVICHVIVNARSTVV